MALVLTLAMSLPAFAAAITPSTKTETKYMSSNDGTAWVSVDLATGSKAFTIKRADVKVTAGTTGAKMTHFSKYASNNTYANNNSGKWKSSKSTYYSYGVELDVKKAGTATVAYKIGSKTYKKKIKVLKYKNPAKTVTLTGVNGGKNMASLTKTSHYSSKTVALKANKASAKLTVKPIAGWKIQTAELYDWTNGSRVEMGNYSKGLSSVALNCGKIVANHDYGIEVEFRNTSNNATIYCSYDIHGAKAK